MEFSDIAFNKLYKTVPELSSLVVDFTDLSSEISEEGEVKFGVFSLISGGSLFFIPIIGKGDNIFPIDNIFFADDEKFFPLSKTTTNLIINSHQNSIGKAEKIPVTAIRNPSVQELVDPPRTGKISYSSEERFLEFLASVTPKIKETLNKIILKEKDMQTTLHKMYGLPAILEAIKIPAIPLKVEEKETGELRVITEGNNLPDWAIQKIINQGYAVLGKSNTCRMAIPLYEKSQNDLAISSLSSIDFNNKAFLFCNINGDDIAGIAVKPHFAGKQDNIIMTVDGMVHRQYRDSPSNPIYIGTELTTDKILDKVDNMSARLPISNIGRGISSLPDGVASIRGGQDIIFYNDELIGIVDSYFTRKVKDGVIQLTTTYPACTILISPSYSGAPRKNGDTIILPMNDSKIYYRNMMYGPNLETSINRIYNSKNAKLSYLLDESLKVSTKDDNEFYINGVKIGEKPKAIKVLIVDEGIDPSNAESILKRASERGYCEVLLSKKAEAGDEIPQYGEEPEPQPEEVWGNSLPSRVAPASALGNGSQDILSVTFISEILQDPDLYETIEEYLPDIAEAIDKLGRILLLVRLKSSKVMEDNGLDQMTNLITSLRNSYKILGDNYVKLENIISNATIEAQ